MKQKSILANARKILHVLCHTVKLGPPLGRSLVTAMSRCFAMPLFWGRCPATYAGPAWVLFPSSVNTLRCGLAGLISIQHGPHTESATEQTLETLAKKIQAQPLKQHLDHPSTFEADYMDGKATLDELYAAACNLKIETPFID